MLIEVDFLKKAKLFFLNAVILIITSFIIRTSDIFFNVYIINKIGAESVGIFQIIMSVYIFAITVASSGISIATMRLVTEQISKSDISGVKKVVHQSMLYSLFFSIVASMILIFSSNFIVNYCLKNKISSASLYIISIGLPFISMSSAINGYFSAIRKISKTAISQILEQVVKIISTLILLSFLFKKGLNYVCISLITGDVISEIASFSLIYILYKFENNKNIKISNKSYTKDIFKISLPLALTSYIRSGLSTVKQLLIPMGLQKAGNSFSSAFEQYGMITGMVFPIILFPSVLINSFSSLLIPEFSYYYNEKNNLKINKICTRIFKSTYIFSICVFGLFFTFADNLGSFIYNTHRITWYIMIISPLIILMYIDSVVDSMLKGLNQQVNVMKCNILDLVVSIPILYILLPIYRNKWIYYSIIYKRIFKYKYKHKTAFRYYKI